MDDIDLENDGWLKAAIGVLWFCGVCYVLIGVGFGAMFALAALSLPNGGAGGEGIMLLMFSLVMLGVGVGCGVGNFVVAQALAKRKKWGWIAGLIIGGIYAPSGCLPFGAVILYALLRSGVKQKYEAAAVELAAAQGF